MLKVSVVIPSYNRAHLISRALDSVFAQGHPIHEVIVVDDGSGDGTHLKIRRDYPSAHLIRQRHRGVAAARNRGIRSATGTWIALLDSDDCWAPEKLSKQVEEVLKHPRHPLCHTNEIWIRNGERVHPLKKHEKKGGRIFRDCLPLCMISPSSVLIQKRCIEAVGYFDEGFPVCEDYELWLRICAGYSVSYIDEPLTVKYGGHNDQLSKKYWGMDRFRVQAIDHLLSSSTVYGADQDAAIEMLHEKCAVLVKGAVKYRNHAILNVCRHLMAKFPLNDMAMNPNTLYRRPGPVARAMRR
ncbi:MAG: glycosyltransferase family 2 protein [Nitrospiria bacterium]